MTDQRGDHPAARQVKAVLVHVTRNTIRPASPEGTSNARAR
jgi:hypothetical protein